MKGDPVELLDDRVYEGFTYQGFVAFLAGVAAVAGSFAAAGNTEAFVGTVAFDLLVQYTPGILVTLVLENLGTFGQGFALLGGLLLWIAFVGTFSFASILFGRYTGVSYVSGVLAFALTLVFATTVTGVVLPATVSALFAGAVVGAFDYRYERGDRGEMEPQRKPDQDRRRALQASAGTVGVAGASYFLGSYFTPDEEREYLGAADSPPAEVQRLLAESEEKSLEIDDLPPLVSEYGEFYTIDINTVPPDVDKGDWSLKFTGLVEDEVDLTYDDLTSMEAEHRFIVLRCVGDDLNGDQMDNAVWTGVPMAPLVDEASPDGDHVVMHGHDGFFNTVPLEVLRDGFLAYGMNGEELPRAHGHPVRILLPGHWGEVNVKWVHEIEVVAEDEDGYWERRGWDGTGRVNRVAKLWMRETDEDESVIRVGGHAYAGLAGVDAVEVSTDGGESWEEATLSEPLDEDADYPRDMLRQWVYEWSASEDREYEVVVRMIDGNGELQEQERSSSSPDGATGWVSETVSL